MAEQLRAIALAFDGLNPDGTTADADGALAVEAFDVDAGVWYVRRTNTTLYGPVPELTGTPAEKWEANKGQFAFTFPFWNNQPTNVWTAHTAVTTWWRSLLPEGSNPYGSNVYTGLETREIVLYNSFLLGEDSKPSFPVRAIGFGFYLTEDTAAGQGQQVADALFNGISQDPTVKDRHIWALHALADGLRRGLVDLRAFVSDHDGTPMVEFPGTGAADDLPVLPSVEAAIARVARAVGVLNSLPILVRLKNGAQVDVRAGLMIPGGEQQ